MPEYVAILSKLRADLGLRYTVGAEQINLSSVFHILIVRQRDAGMLTIVTDLQWLTASIETDTPTHRIEYKHLIVAIKNYFRHPEALPESILTWPGTQESREDIRRALTPRRPRRLMVSKG